jgi:hypothetical protein
MIGLVWSGWEYQKAFYRMLELEWIGLTISYNWRTIFSALGVQVREYLFLAILSRK